MSRATVVLPHPVAPTRATDCAWLDDEIELVEDARAVVAVGEGHGVEPHLAEAVAVRARGRQLARLGMVDDLRVGREDLSDTAGGGRGSLSLSDDLPEHAQRPDEERDIGVERDELADRQMPVEHEVAAVAEDGEEAQVREEIHRRHVAGPHLGRVDRALVHVVGLGPQLRRLHTL